MQQILTLTLTLALPWCVTKINSRWTYGSIFTKIALYMQQILDCDSDSRSAFMYNKKKQSMWTYIHPNSAIYATNPDCDSDSHSALVYNKKSQIPRYPQKGLIHPEDVYIHKKAPNIGPRKKKPNMSAKEPSTSTKEPSISLEILITFCLLYTQKSHTYR